MKNITIIMFKWKALITGLLLIGIISCNRSGSSEYSIMEGNFIQSFTESGELQAISATTIYMPRIDYRYGYRFKIVGILEYGETVEEGDSVVALDPSSIYKYIIFQEEALENARGKVEKQKVEAEIKRRDLEVKLKNQEASFNLKELELERMQFESDLKKSVKELEFKKAKLELEKVKRNLDLYPLLEKYDRLINELELIQLQANIENAEEALNNLVLRSPGKGYFITNYNSQGGHNYSLGDEVYMGRTIARIPDVSRMKVKSIINETDISKVEEEMKVNIRLNALPGITFKAKVYNISKICKEENGQRIFQSEIHIVDNDPRLKPGMSVSCEYICYKSENELFVPNECLMSQDDKVYLFLKRGNRIIKKAVETGISNANYTTLHTKLKPGIELVPPSELAEI